MKRALLALLAAASAFTAEPEFPLTADSKPQEGSAKGTLLKGSYTARDGSVFPGTVREYQIYLPADFDKTKPAPFMVFQDGVIYQAPVVFDNLIAKKDIPPLVGLFIKPGVVPAANDNALPRFNRSYEYDSVTDTYSRFLIEEFLPAIEAEHGLQLSTDPNHAAIAGNSSGGICAFMAAWHRPDRFRRVFTGVGTYVGIRGADRLPVLVRKIEPKPLRVFLQSGTGDNDLYCGDWWMANQMMQRSLAWAGYDVNHAWGEGGHNQKHASQVFPEAMRWLWRDWQTDMEIKANPKDESKWKGYEVVGEGEWEKAYDGHSHEGATFDMARHLTSVLDGTVFSWSEHSLIYRININGKVDSIAAKTTLQEMLPAADGSLIYVGSKSDLHNGIEGLIEAVSPRERHTIHRGISGNAAALLNDQTLIVSARGDIAVLNKGKEQLGKGWNANSRGTYSSSLTLSPDQSILYITSLESDCVATLGITPDRYLTNYQPFVYLEMDGARKVMASGLSVDTNGWLYVATALGIQVCDQAGRVNFILPTPKQPYDLCFGGKDLSELFIACGDSIYKRPTKAKGVVSGQQAPIKPAPPKL